MMHRRSNLLRPIADLRKQRGYIINPYAFATGGGGGGGGDEYFANVSSLLHFDGSDASTTFTDVTGKTWSVVSNAQLDTAQFKFGTASYLGDGSGDAITTPAHTDFDMGSGDFCIEFWLRPAATLVDDWLCGQSDSGNTGASTSFNMRKYSDDKIYASVYTGSVQTQIISSTTLAANTWYHVAFTRNGTAGVTLRLFIDGTQRASAAYAGTVNTSTNQLAIGKNGENTFGPNSYSGWIDDFRITKGVARYTANFTPPTEAFPDS